MPTRPPDLPDSALARLFFDGGLEPAWIAVPGGAPLFEAGEAAERLYFVRAGRFGVTRPGRAGDVAPRLIGVIKPGEPAGEMALIAGTPHTSTVTALRDSEVLALDRAELFAAAERDPAVMTELARLILRRTREPTAVAARASVFGFVGLSPAVQVRAFVEALAVAVARLGDGVEVIGREAQEAPTAWFTAVEQSVAYVLYAAEADEPAWRSLCARQVDRLFLVGQGGAAPEPARPGAPRGGKRQELILLRPAGRAIAGTATWLDAEPVAEVHHAEAGSAADVERLARMLTGRDVALVLSGGGARAYAHVGAIRALREAGVPIDAVGGASMGAIIGASVASGRTDEELDVRIRQAFVDSSPLDDIAFPILAMTQGRKVETRLDEHFGDLLIEDLPIPFFAVSSNLTSGRPRIHERGRLAPALRASAALPGVLPPLTEGGQVLVDGAVMRNFPADLMRARHDGPIVGVDVTRARGLTPGDIVRPPSALRWLLSGEWRKGPPIVSVLMSSAVAPAYREHEETRESADLLIAPDVARVNIRDWKAFEPAVEAGRLAAAAALQRLDRPVTELRHALAKPLDVSST
jgi:NTE family protein